MKIVVILLLKFFSHFSEEVLPVSNGDKNLYIFEYAMKKPGEVNITFAETKDTLVKITDYTVYLSEDYISKVKKRGEGEREYYKNERGNINIGNNETEYYSSENYTEHLRVSEHYKFWRKIVPAFVKADNRKRLDIIESYICK